MNIKKVLHILEGLITMFFIFMCTSVNVPHSETKTINHNLNKTLDLHAMAVKYEEIKRNDLYAPLIPSHNRIAAYNLE